MALPEPPTPSLPSSVTSSLLWSLLFLSLYSLLLWLHTQNHCCVCVCVFPLLSFLFSFFPSSLPCVSPRLWSSSQTCTTLSPLSCSYFAVLLSSSPSASYEPTPLFLWGFIHCLLPHVFSQKQHLHKKKPYNKNHLLIILSIKHLGSKLIPTNDTHSILKLPTFSNTSDFLKSLIWGKLLLGAKSEQDVTDLVLVQHDFPLAAVNWRLKRDKDLRRQREKNNDKWQEYHGPCIFHQSSCLPTSSEEGGSHGNTDKEGQSER